MPPPLSTSRCLVLIHPLALLASPPRASQLLPRYCAALAGN
ncbi:hypothetical protein E2C01_059185 [Portunus trituberculatus]|uniref:Uncharacterized protein n=1 Tax=Portunus trituberculatus TaxID=210409 RepID=A0A5B7GXD7_PORTR|nr:hypothetical protein [Portunus trituberculatus]